MRQIIIISSVFLTILLLSSCQKEHILIKGKGPSLINTRQLDHFKSVTLCGDFHLEIHKDSIFKVVLYGQQNILDIIETKISGDRLKVGLEPGASIRKSDPVTIKVYMPDLEQTEISGSGNMSISEEFALTSLNCNVSGSGDIICQAKISQSFNATISGSGTIKCNGTSTCNNGKFDISGSGEMNAESMQINNLDADISGSGNMYVNVLEILNARISGSGKIHYRGHPKINVNISGSGRLVSVN